MEREEVPGSTNVTIDGVKHVFKHCPACETAKDLMAQFIECRRALDKIRMIVDDHIYVSANPFTMETTQFEHPMNQVYRKLKAIETFLKEANIS